MVGIVFVSHSATLARGALELARAMAGEEVPLAAAGGTGDPEAPLGTDATAVAEAEAHRGLAAKQEHLEDEPALSDRPTEDEPGAPDEAAGGVPGAVSTRVELTNRLGLHARPAARLVQAAARFDARVTVANFTNGKGPVSAASLTGLARLGARAGHELEIAATGIQAAAAISGLEDLVAGGLGDAAEEPGPAAQSPGPPAGDRGAAVTGDGSLRGIPASPGAAWGPARRLSRGGTEGPGHAADDPGKAWARLRDALAATGAEIAGARAAAVSSGGEAAAGILDALLLMLQDEALLGEARRLIEREKRNSAAAWHEVIDSAARDYRALEDDYQAARADDLVQLDDQVRAHLGGGHVRPDLTAPGVLVAEDLGPAQLASLEPGEVDAIATAAGGPTSHVAIMARALGVPAVVGLGPALESVTDGQRVLVDGDSGQLLLDPAPDVL